MSTELSKLEEFHGLKYPPHSQVIRAYLHYEALVTHDYAFTCVECGIYPPVIITDVDKKCCFRLKGGLLIIKLYLLAISSSIFE